MFGSGQKSMFDGQWMVERFSHAFGNQFSLVVATGFEPFGVEGDRDEDTVGDMKDGEVECEDFAEEPAQFAGDIFWLMLIFESMDGFFYDRVAGIMGGDE